METIVNGFAEYLFTQSWHIGVLFVVVAGATFMLRKANAHWRYLLWCVVLAKCLVPPLMTISVAILPNNSPQPSVVSHQEITAAQAPNTEEINWNVENISPVGEKSQPRAAVPHDQETNEADSVGWEQTVSLEAKVAGLWLGGMGVFLVIAAFKAIKTGKWLVRERKTVTAEHTEKKNECNHELTLIDTDLEHHIKELAGKIGLKKAPRVWLVDGIGQPFVRGFLRGSIYLPADFTQNGTALHRRGILLHELSHVKRFDAGVNFLQAIAQGLFWFHPLVWWANKKIREEREKCCDESAVAVLGEAPSEYGKAIVDTLVREYQSTRAIPVLAVAGPIKNIEERIKTIMTPGKKFYKHPTLAAVVTVLVIVAVVVPIAFALGTKPPKDLAKENLATENKETLTTEHTEATEHINYVRLVLGEDEATFQGRWLADDINDLSVLLSELPDRNNTVLELAFAPGKIPEKNSMARLGMAYGLMNIEKLAEKHRLKGIVYTEQPLGSLGHSFGGFFKQRFILNKDIPVDFQSSDGLVKCMSIKFEQTGKGLAALLQANVTSHPKTMWEFRLELQSSKQDGSMALYRRFENAGVIERFPLLSGETIEFLQGGFEVDANDFDSFELRIRQIKSEEEANSVGAANMPIMLGMGPPIFGSDEPGGFALEAPMPIMPGMPMGQQAKLLSADPNIRMQPYSEPDTSDPNARAIFEKTLTQYQSMKTYSDSVDVDNEIKLIDAKDVKQTSSTTVKISTKLARPEHYLIEWAASKPPYAGLAGGKDGKYTVLLDGSTDSFVKDFCKSYDESHLIPSDANARNAVNFRNSFIFANAYAGYSLETVTAMFFSNSPNMFRIPTDLKLLADEQIENDVCYVMSGRQGIWDATYWISKQNLLIRKRIARSYSERPTITNELVKTILENRKEAATPEAIEHEKKVIEAQWADWPLKREMVFTEIHRNIVIDAPMGVEEFNIDPNHQPAEGNLVGAGIEY